MMYQHLNYKEINAGELMSHKINDRILVVDDNLPMRKALVETLRFLNYNTLEAGNGKEALDLIEKLRTSCRGDNAAVPGLIMSDLAMPVMDGRELFYELKKRNIDLPFVMLSGYLASNALDDLIEMGISAWLQKPADINQISNLLEKILK
jgi:two-component system response regulator FlrC